MSKVNFVSDELTVYNFIHPRLPKSRLLFYANRAYHPDEEASTERRQTDVDVNAVGAMDVSRNGAQRSGYERNRPQRRPSQSLQLFLGMRRNVR
jgi:hypothetical protein